MYIFLSFNRYPKAYRAQHHDYRARPARCHLTADNPGAVCRASAEGGTSNSQTARAANYPYRGLDVSPAACGKRCWKISADHVLTAEFRNITQMTYAGDNDRGIRFCLSKNLGESLDPFPAQ
jgi:hypothetical protein